MKKFLAIFATLFLTSLSSQAMFLVDPYLGYVVSGSTSTNYNISGTEFGARAGFSTLGFGYGLDATIAGTLSYKDSSNTYSYTPTFTGLFVSYSFPILVRGYATYFFDTKLKDSTNTVKGTATKIGVQYTGFPFVAIGLETLSATYTEINGSALSTNTTETQTRLALSVPFSL